MIKFEAKRDFRIPGTDSIVEKGDRIQILSKKTEAVKFGTGGPTLDKARMGYELQPKLFWTTANDILGSRAYSFGSTSGGMRRTSWSDQTVSWNMLAQRYGYKDGLDQQFLDDFDEVVVKKFYPGDDGFPGVEWLTTQSAYAKKLWFHRTDFYKCDKGDSTFMEMGLSSYLYGGKRLEMWKKYSKIGSWGPEEVTKAFLQSQTLEVTEVSGRPDTFRALLREDYEKKELLEMLEALEKYFDFDIAEPEASSTWTITVKKNSGQKDAEFASLWKSVQFDKLKTNLEQNLGATNIKPTKIPDYKMLWQFKMKNRFNPGLIDVSLVFANPRTVRSDEGLVVDVTVMGSSSDFPIETEKLEATTTRQVFAVLNGWYNQMA